MSNRRLVLLVQLPVPPPGPGMVEGNVPLAAAYLKLFARRRGLEEFYNIEVLPPAAANALGDQALIRAILARQPWMVGFTCYLWNIERTLWIAGRLRQSRPELKILLGGPEITADNQWVLQSLVGQIGNRRTSFPTRPSLGTSWKTRPTLDNLPHGVPAADYAVLGEGEATLAELLAALVEPAAEKAIAGLWQSGRPTPPPRAPLADLDAISSPYVEGILDLSESRRMLLETTRGCRFRCKYCYYPKGDAPPRFLSPEQVLANLNYAAEHGADEVVLLDPTLNQRPDFIEFLALLRRGNAAGKLRFSAELRAEGIDAAAARLLRQAGFHEVEIGLQSVEPRAWDLMGRPTNLAAFEQGVRAMLDEGIEARVDLILGLPGDTADSIRRGIDFLHTRRLYTQVQVFNLSILPGTAFRQQAGQLGLTYQPWPPYYVLRTPTLDVELLCRLMDEAQEAFATEFDPLPPPRPDLFQPGGDPCRGCRIDLDSGQTGQIGNSVPLLRQKQCEPGTRSSTASDEAVAHLPGANSSQDHARRISLPAICFTLWLRSADFHRRRHEAAGLIAGLLSDNPHTTLQVVLEPAGDPRRLTPETLELLLAACYRNPTYLDRYYSLHPGKLLGSKRLAVWLPPEWRERADEDWRRDMSEYATLL